LRPEPRGSIKAEHIKLMRLILTSPLKTAMQVQGKEKLLPEILYIAKSVAKTA
jgi:hypothetical protein